MDGNPWRLPLPLGHRSGDGGGMLTAASSPGPGQWADVAETQPALCSALQDTALSRTQPPGHRAAPRPQGLKALGEVAIHLSPHPLLGEPLRA